MNSSHPLVSLFRLTVLLAIVAVGVGCGSSAPSKPNGGGGGGKGKDAKIKPYTEVITKEAVSDSGMFMVHRIGESLFFEIPDSLLGRDLLLISRIAKVPANLAGGFIAAGHKTGEQVLRWERVGDRVLVRKASFEAVAADSLPIHRSVVNNNFAPIIAAFPVAAVGPAKPDTVDGKAQTTVIVDVSEFYTTDVPAISGLDRSLRDSYKVRSLDKDRSFLNYAHAYPMNVDVRSTLTFTAQAPPVNSETETLSLEMHQSMVLLPREPMRARYADPRLGYFSLTQVNYGIEQQKAAEQTFISRWRLEPKDPAAYARGELVEPIKPIVYYIDPATPEKWRAVVKQGVEDWQTAFETAGFKNAILAKDPPTAEEDPDWNGEDVRYSMVRWAASQYRNAMGPSAWDPRTGEIIESDIVWYHNHMRSYRNRLMLETGASNPLARSLPIDDGLMGEAMRQVIAHEIGHALGLPHNMIASASYSVDSLRTPEFCSRMGVSPSVMEYGRQNYIAQPGDGLQGADYIRKIGVYDHYAINWGYRVIPGAATPDDEKPVLDGWIREKSHDPMYRYSPQRGGLPVDPRVQTEDLGDDPVRASGYGIANLKVVAPQLVAWTSKNGEDYTELNELYDELLFQWSRYLSHVVSVVGGIYMDLKASDQEGWVYDPVPAAQQREAMKFLAGEAMATPEWLNDPNILRRIEHAGAVDRLRAYQTRILNQLLDPERMARLVETEALAGRSAYSLVAFMDDMKASVWGEMVRGGSVDAYRRSLQRSYLERLEWLLTDEPSSRGASDFLWNTPVDVSTSDIRAVVRAQLKEIASQSRRAASSASDRMARMHYDDTSRRVEVILEREIQGD